MKDYTETISLDAVCLKVQTIFLLGISPLCYAMIQSITEESRLYQIQSKNPSRFLQLWWAYLHFPYIYIYIFFRSVKVVWDAD